MEWFRVWHGAVTDSKWHIIARRASVSPMMVSAVFLALLDYASQRDDRGSVEGFDAEGYAAWGGCDDADVINIISAMRDRGVITEDNRLAAWEKRQPKREDDSRSRVRRYRDRQKETQSDAEINTVTQCNASVTQCNGAVTHSNGSVTPQSRAEQNREEIPTNVGMAQAAPVAPRPKRSAKKDNPNREHPAVQAYHDMHERWPQIAQMALIAEHNPPLDAWVRALRAWAGKGYNPQNIAGILEWAENPAKLESVETVKVMTNGKPDYNAGKWLFSEPPDYTNKAND